VDHRGTWQQVVCGWFMLRLLDWAAKGHQMTSESGADAVELIAASTPAHYEQVQELFIELMAWDCARVSELGFDSALAQQFYYSQVAAPLPGQYAPPDGQLFWAKYAGNSAGCGAFTKLSPGVCVELDLRG
jgi:hypothetical protein